MSKSQPDPDPSRLLWSRLETACFPETKIEEPADSCHHCDEPIALSPLHSCHLCGFWFCTKCTAWYHLPSGKQSDKRTDSLQRVCYLCTDVLLGGEPWPHEVFDGRRNVLRKQASTMNLLSSPSAATASTSFSSLPTLRPLVYFDKPPPSSSLPSALSSLAGALIHETPCLSAEFSPVASAYSSELPPWAPPPSSCTAAAASVSTTTPAGLAPDLPDSLPSSLPPLLDHTSASSDDASLSPPLPNVPPPPPNTLLLLPSRYSSSELPLPPPLDFPIPPSRYPSSDVPPPPKSLPLPLSRYTSTDLPPPPPEEEEENSIRSHSDFISPPPLPTQSAFIEGAEEQDDEEEKRKPALPTSVPPLSKSSSISPSTTGFAPPAPLRPAPRLSPLPPLPSLSSLPSLPSLPFTPPPPALPPITPPPPALPPIAPPPPSSADSCSTAASASSSSQSDRAPPPPPKRRPVSPPPPLDIKPHVRNTSQTISSSYVVPTTPTAGLFVSPLNVTVNYSRITPIYDNGRHHAKPRVSSAPPPVLVVASQGPQPPMGPLSSTIAPPTQKWAAGACFKCQEPFFVVVGGSNGSSSCNTCGRLFCIKCVSRKELPEPFVMFTPENKGVGVVCDICRFALVRGAILTDVIGDEVGGVESIEIEDLLKLPQYVHVMRIFLAKSQSLENLHFLEMVEIYERLAYNPTNQLLPLAQEIYHEFIGPNAVQLVNIDSECHSELTARIEGGEVDGRVFQRAAINVTKLVQKDVFKRFCQTIEARKLLAESDAATFNKYLKNRDKRLSFSRLQKMDDITSLELLINRANSSLEKEKKDILIKTVHVGRQKFTNSVDGKSLVDYFLFKNVVPSRAGAFAIAQRLIEAGVIQHVTQPRWMSFQETEVYMLTSSYFANLPRKEKWPPVISLMNGKENVMNAFLLRGVRYNRLWCVGSLEHSKLFFYRSEACDVPHSCIPLKGASVVFECGGENEIEESIIPGFRKTATVTEAREENTSRFRYGQIYMRLTIPWENNIHPLNLPPPQCIYMFENAASRPRWKKFFTDAGVPLQSVFHKGISARAVVDVTELHSVRGIAR